MGSGKGAVVVYLRGGIAVRKVNDDDPYVGAPAHAWRPWVLRPSILPATRITRNKVSPGRR